MIGVRTGVPDRSQEQTKATKVRPLTREGDNEYATDAMDSMKQFMMPKGGEKAEYVGWGEPVNQNPFHATGAPNAAEFGMIEGQPKGKK